MVAWRLDGDVLTVIRLWSAFEIANGAHGLLLDLNAKVWQRSTWSKTSSKYSCLCSLSSGCLLWVSAAARSVRACFDTVAKLCERLTAMSSSLYHRSAANVYERVCVCVWVRACVRACVRGRQIPLQIQNETQQAKPNPPTTWYKSNKSKYQKLGFGIWIQIQMQVQNKSTYMDWNQNRWSGCPLKRRSVEAAVRWSGCPLKQTSAKRLSAEKLSAEVVCLWKTHKKKGRRFEFHAQRVAGPHHVLRVANAKKRAVLLMFYLCSTYF